MRRISACVLFGLALGAAATTWAESKSMADYPLRIHIFKRSETSFYHRRYMEEAKGEGRANLFENGEARGIDFNFDCDQKLKDSFGYETYPARWHKPGKELTVLLPVFGKTGQYFTCNVKTDVKDFAYMEHNGRMSSEPVPEFKQWMVKHDYDPEHGKNEPTKMAPGDAHANPAAGAAPGQP
jgi:hypothetical protein